MGRASRRKREGRPKLGPRQPWWSVYTRVHMMLAAIEREATDGSPSVLVEALEAAHVIYVDPVQASAAPRPPVWSMDFLPFPVVLLATGEASGDLNSPPYAALMIDRRHLPPPVVEDHPGWHDIAIFPIYASARLWWQGIALLTRGELTTTAFGNWRAGMPLTEAHLREDQDTRRGAAIALAALELLRSVNVDLEPVAAAQRGHRAAGVPGYEVVIRQHRAATRRVSEVSAVDWSHRWEVRGHYKHFTRGPIFNANPSRRVTHGGVECVRIWCPPFVKGPDDKPLVPKARRIAHAALPVAENPT